MDIIEKVERFYEKFGLPVPPIPGLLDNQQQLYRLARMLEELHEFEQAHLNGDLVKAADALADLVYFAIGTATQMGIPFHGVFSAVHTANLSKIRVDSAGQSKYGDGSDIVKPEGWVSPNVEIARLIELYSFRPDETR